MSTKPFKKNGMNFFPDGTTSAHMVPFLGYFQMLRGQAVYQLICKDFKTNHIQAQNIENASDKVTLVFATPVTALKYIP